MKYRIKYNDPYDCGWLWLTPFSMFYFLFTLMGVKGKYTIESKKHWWNKWKVINEFDNKVDAYIAYFKIAYDLDIEEKKCFPHNRDKNKNVYCELTLQHNTHPIDPEYEYIAGYKPRNYARYYYACYSSKSYEDALHKLYWDLEVKKLIKKKE